MFGLPALPADPRWGYDDPSGVPEEVTVTLRLPERLLESVQRTAGRAGATPSAWLLDLIARSVAS
jgi:hypothetical protein